MKTSTAFQQVSELQQEIQDSHREQRIPHYSMQPAISDRVKE